MQRWRIIDFGEVPETGAREIPFQCSSCEKEALMPVVGTAIAQFAGGVVFDPGPKALPQSVVCPHCRIAFTGGGKP